MASLIPQPARLRGCLREWSGRNRSGDGRPGAAPPAATRASDSASSGRADQPQRWRMATPTRAAPLFPWLTLLWNRAFPSPLQAWSAWGGKAVAAGAPIPTPTVIAPTAAIAASRFFIICLLLRGMRRLDTIPPDSRWARAYNRSARSRLLPQPPSKDNDPGRRGLPQSDQKPSSRPGPYPTRLCIRLFPGRRAAKTGVCARRPRPTRGDPTRRPRPLTPAFRFDSQGDGGANRSDRS
jgi:hypothetical protein